MPTTIGRNRRQYVNNIKAAFTVCHRYNPDTGQMEPCDPAEAWDLLARERDARLIEHDDRKFYTVQRKGAVYELRRPEES